MPQVRDSQHIADSVRAVAGPIVRALALDLVAVQCVGQGARMIVRVFIDKPGGVTVADCEQVHVSLGHALDVQDPIQHTYTLEVSSPGLDRPFSDREQYRRAIGKRINVKLREPWEGRWRVVGELLGEDDQGLMLSVAAGRQTQTIRLRWDTIAEGRLEVTF